MKALHTYTTIDRQPKRRPCADDTLDVKKKKSKTKKGGGEKRGKYYTSKSSKSKEKTRAPRLEIVPVRVVVRFSHPRIKIRRNNALNTTTLRRRGPSKSTRSCVMKSPLRPASSCCCYVRWWRWSRRRRWALWDRRGRLRCRRHSHFVNSPGLRVRGSGRGR